MKLTKKQREKAEAVFCNGRIREGIKNAVDEICRDYQDSFNITEWFMDAIVNYHKL